MAPTLNEPGLNRDGADPAAPTEQSTDAAFAGVRQTADPEITPRQAVAVAGRQDELMAVESVEGRPPPHRLRTTEWRWAAIAALILVLGAAAWALIRGVSVGAVFGFGSALLLVVVLGGWPVLAAATLRGKEERAARKEAIAELPQRDKRGKPAG